MYIYIYIYIYICIYIYIFFFLPRHFQLSGICGMPYSLASLTAKQQLGPHHETEAEDDNQKEDTRHTKKVKKKGS